MYLFLFGTLEALNKKVVLFVSLVQFCFSLLQKCEIFPHVTLWFWGSLCSVVFTRLMKSSLLPLSPQIKLQAVIRGKTFGSDGGRAPGKVAQALLSQLSLCSCWMALGLLPALWSTFCFHGRFLPTPAFISKASFYQLIAI